MVSYGALERSNNPHIESIGEPCVFQNQKQILAMWVWLGRKFWKRDFKTTKLLTKTLFFLYFRDRPKNGEGNKEDVESICATATKYTSKYVAKAEFNLNWLWTIDYMDFFHCVFKSTDNLAHFIPMLWLASLFLCFLQHLLQEYEEHET